MRIDYLSPDILLFRGDSLAALATAFIDGERVLLAGSLASEYDTIEMRDYLERDRGLRIDTVLLTAQGQDAGLHMLRGVRVERPAGSASMAWGRHQLAIFPVGGTVAIEAAADGLLLVGQRLVGTVALIGDASPGEAQRALAQLQQRGMRRIVPAHQGAADAIDLAHAQTYLERLRLQVGRVRAMYAGGALHAALAAIALEDCLADGVHASPLERHWHLDNLRRIAARDLFPALNQAPVKRSWLRGNSVLGMLTCMLGRLGRSGV